MVDLMSSSAAQRTDTPTAQKPPPRTRTVSLENCSEPNPAPYGLNGPYGTEIGLRRVALGTWAQVHADLATGVMLSTAILDMPHDYKWYIILLRIGKTLSYPHNIFPTYELGRARNAGSYAAPLLLKFRESARLKDITVNCRPSW